METKTTAKTAKQTQRQPSDPYKITWEKMKPYEVQYAKHDLAKMEPLVQLLHQKFLDSLSQEQQMMYFAVNGARHMADDFDPRPNLRDVRERCLMTGRYTTLNTVRDQLREVQGLLLGRHMGTFYEENQRSQPAHDALKAIVKEAQAAEYQGKGE